MRKRIECERMREGDATVAWCIQDLSNGSVDATKGTKVTCLVQQWVFWVYTGGCWDVRKRALFREVRCVCDREGVWFLARGLFDWEEKGRSTRSTV